MINDQGGINGRKIRFIYENDSYQPAKTVAAVKKLVEEDKVFALCGGLGTAHNAAVMDYLVAKNVPHVWPATGTTALAVPLKKNIYAVQLNYTTETTLATQYALDTMGTKKIAVFLPERCIRPRGTRRGPGGAEEARAPCRDRCVVRDGRHQLQRA